MRRFGIFVRGEFQHTGDSYEIRDPFDGEVVARVERGGPEVVEGAIGDACGVAAEMAALPGYRKSAILARMRDGLAARMDELTEVIRAEAGKPVRFARIEVERCLDTFADASEVARHEGGELLNLDAFPPGAGRVGMVRRVPVGPVSAITPFNFPLNLVAHKVAPAIAAGCPVVLKPASQTPSAALILGELAAEAGLPPGGLSVIPCSRAGAGAFTTDDRLRLLTFTGSPEVGWALKALAGRKKVVLELGGNAAAIVEPDADLDAAAAKLAGGAYYYAGQSCISVQRIFVHRAVADAFRDRLVAAVENVPFGATADEGCVSGPVIDGSNAERIEAWIGEARQRGGRLLTGGDRTGNVIRPCLLEDTPGDCAVVAREAFGPVANLYSHDHFDGALARVNDSRFGLQAGVFTSDVRKLTQALATLEVGAVVHDDSPAYRVDHMPYGGVKESGIGREGARYAVEDMTEPRMLVLQT
ncbi:MAG: aldehyde dehydrogenase family protein [Myxococcota bacterium]|jgi:acyl-CoA reductase-like NAD-dependent aldehyde dehydrogenase|nr:aldehyde dehydrogenase family protein [Myxococcota bacterium]